MRRTFMRNRIPPVMVNGVYVFIVRTNHGEWHFPLYDNAGTTPGGNAVQNDAP